MAKSLLDGVVEGRMRRSWWNGLVQSASELSARSLDNIPDRDTWQKRRPVARQQLLWMLGLDPLPPRSPLAARTTGTVIRDGYVVEKVVFESLPGLWVTANLYVPERTSKPAPCILYLCGHQIHPLGAKTQFQDRLLWYPENGFACLAVDSLLCGEIQGCHRGTHTLGRWDWLSRGYTPAGIEVWNAIRALDYLESRPEVDPDRMGLTGTSGGGVMAWMVSAVEDRVRVVVPSASAYTVYSQVKRRLLPFQCDCTYFPNVFRMDFPEVAALSAPKPVRIMAGRGDRIFPPVGYRELFRKVSALYRLYGEAGEGRFELAECNRGHAETAESLRLTREWMVKWLAPESAGAVDHAARSVPQRPEDLACLKEIPSDLANYTIHQSFVPVPALRTPGSADEWRTRREDVTGRLRSTVFNWFPETNPIPFQSRRLPGSGGHARRFARFSVWEFTTETIDRVRVQLFEPLPGGGDAPLLLLVKGRGEQWMFPDDEWLPLLADHRVLLLSPRFADWNPSASGLATVERAAALCGRTIAALQVWDVLRTVRWALEDRKWNPSRITVLGRRDAAAVALYAGVWEPRIHHVVLQDPPASHRDGPALLTILRTTDIPEAAGLLAPRDLTVVGEPSGAYQLTRDIFRVAGVAERFRVVGSLVAALRGKGAGSALRPGSGDR